MKELELYIHIPFCIRKCRYCDFLSFPADESARERYMKALLQEIAAKGRTYRNYQVSTIFFGGGTPSCIQAEHITAVMEQIRRSFMLREDAEVSLECNPGTVDAGKLRAYRACGINRLSIGLQSADDRELQVLGRIHSYDRFLETYHLARECGFSNINIDLISSLPGQTKESFAGTLEKVLALEPEHLSVYSLIIEPGTPFYELYEEDILRRERGEETYLLPDEETEYQIGKETIQTLAQHGYRRYEISNYAKEGYACRHNIGYWTGVEYLGLGLGASSYIKGVSSPGRSERGISAAERRKNTESMEVYLAAVGQGQDPCEEVQLLDRQAEMEEYLFLGLRMCEGVSRCGFAELFGAGMEDIYPQQIAKLTGEGLLQLEGDRAKLSEQGMDLANYCMAMFLQ